MNGRVVWQLTAAIAAAAIVRAAGIEARTFWGDEVVSLNVATGHSWYPWMGEESELFYSADYYRGLLTLAPDYYSQRLVPLLRVNDQIPPFYYVALNLWMHLFGTSVTALRSLSLVASVASVPVIFALATVLHSRRAGLYAAAIFGLAPFQVAFGLYNRPYALLCFFALASTLAAVRLSRGEATRRWLVIWAVTAALGVYTHYLFVWNLVFQVALVAVSQRHNRPALLRYGAACLGAGAVCLLWAPAFLGQMRWSREVGSQSWFYWYSGSAPLSVAVTSLARNVLLLLTGGRVDGFCSAIAQPERCGVDNALTMLLYLVPLLLIAFCAWHVAKHVRARRELPGSTPDPWVVCVAWATCLLAGPALSDLLLDSHMVFSHRYFIAVSGPLYVAVAMALAQIAAPSVRRAAVGGVLAFLFAGTLLYLQGWSRTLMYEVATRDVAERIDRSATADADLILVLDPGLNPTDFAMQLQSNPDFARVDIPGRRPAAKDIPEQLARLTSAKPRPRVWYLHDYGPETQAHEAMLEWLRSRYAEVEANRLTNVGLYLFAPPTSDGLTPADRTAVR